MKIFDAILSEPLAFHEPALAVVVERYAPFFRAIATTNAESAVQSRLRAEENLSISDFINQRQPYAVSADGIATIHVNDFLARGLTNVDRMLGATDYNHLIDEVAAAQADGSVRGVLLDLNSPGGSVVGCPEAAAAVADLAGSKPVVAYAEMLACSAAYYFAAASHAFIASPSAIVGSIGTIATLMNISGLLSRFGVSVTHFQSGDLKAAGTPYRDMTRDERDFWQERVDQLGGEFRAWVSAHRPAVEKGTMRGQWFSGSEGMSRGLVDQLGSRGQALDALRALMTLR